MMVKNGLVNWIVVNTGGYWLLIIINEGLVNSCQEWWLMNRCLILILDLVNYHLLKMNTYH